MRNKFLIFIIIVLCCIPAVYSLFHTGFFSSDDGEWMIIRFSAFYQALRDGQFPVRWLGRLNYEYGYPVANFLYPGFMYLGVPIHVLGFGFVDTIKIILGVSMVGSAVFTYLWLSKLFDKWSSFVGSIVYVYTPYHLYDLYSRGSVGEVLSLAVLPFILWQIERKSYLWTSLGIGFLLLAHNTLALLFLGIIIVYMGIAIYVSKNKKNLTQIYLLSFLTGFGVSAFFWLPALYDLQYTKFSETQISNWSEYFANNSLIGVSTHVVVLASVILFVTKKIKLKEHRLSIVFLVFALGSIFLSLEQSRIFWEIFPSSFIQFPFRFLSVTIVSVSFLSAVAVSVFPTKHKLAIGVILSVLVLFSASSYLKPQEFFDKGEGFYATNMGTTTVKNEYMPRTALVEPTSRPNQIVEATNAKISDLQVKPNKLSFKIFSYGNSDARILIHKIDFPGLIIEKDDNYEWWPQMLKNDKGLVYFLLPVNWTDGSTLSLSFHEITTSSRTAIRLWSDLISVISIMLLFLVSFKFNKWRVL